MEREGEYFFELNVDELWNSSDSEPASEDFDDEVEDSSFLPWEESEEEDESPASLRPGRRITPIKSITETVKKSPDKSRSPLGRAGSPCPISEPWKTEKDPDVAPALGRFHPQRPPGVQISKRSPHTPKDLFCLFFSDNTVQTICRNTNRNAAIAKESGKKYKWTDVEKKDLYEFFGILIYMSLVSLPSLEDYWRQNHILSVNFPAKVMARERFRSIMRNIHLCDPDKVSENDGKKGTLGHDKLFRLRPLYDDILSACQAYYQPRRELSVDERTLATKARTGLKWYMKNKTTKCGMKLFVLAESYSGYTVRFGLYTGKRLNASEPTLSYDVVMDLVQPYGLGTGYHIYMDSFYTSPKLFRHLADMKFGACGTYRDNRRGCPRGRENALTRNSPRGSIRWIRDGPLLFVKWMDTWEVSICSTIHPAYAGEKTQKRVKGKDGRHVKGLVPCPTAIVDYNKHIGGGNLSDQLIHYYSTHMRTGCWDRTVLLQFLNIATTNAYILHHEMSGPRQPQPMMHKDFMVELVCQLCGVDKAGLPQSRKVDHVPVAIHTPTDVTKGRLKCRHCMEVEKKRNDTPWKCEACDVPLCIMVHRNCFLEWHK